MVPEAVPRYRRAAPQLEDCRRRLRYPLARNRRRHQHRGPAPRGASAAQPLEEVATEIPPVTTQTEKATKISLDGLCLCRRRPTLPHTFACSTIGPAGLDFRVRDGNGYFPRGKITGNLRRIAAVSEPSSGEREPAAEIPSVFCEGSLRQFSKNLRRFAVRG